MRDGSLSTAEKFVLEKSNSGRNTQHRTRIPNNSEVCYQVRDFEKSIRAARAHITATEVAAFMEEKTSFLLSMKKMGDMRN